MPARRPETLERLRQRDAAVVALHRAEPLMAYADIGARFGLCESGVCRVLAKARAQTSRADRRTDRDAKMLAMARRDPSPTLVEIGRAFGLCPSSVSRAIQRAQKREDRLAIFVKARALRRAPVPPVVTVAPVRLKPRIEPQRRAFASPYAIPRDPCSRCGVRGDIGCSHRSIHELV